MKHYYAAVRKELKTYAEKRSRDDGGRTAGDVLGRPYAAIHCATAILEAVRKLGLEIMVGLHAGEYKVSGTEVFGLSVSHRRARRRESACRMKSLVSSAVKDLMSQVWESASRGDPAFMPNSKACRSDGTCTRSNIKVFTKSGRRVL